MKYDKSPYIVATIARSLLPCRFDFQNNTILVSLRQLCTWGVGVMKWAWQHMPHGHACLWFYTKQSGLISETVNDDTKPQEFGTFLCP